MIETAGEGKFNLVNLTSDPAVGFTLWVAIIAVPFQNLSALVINSMHSECSVAAMPMMPARR